MSLKNRGMKSGNLSERKESRLCERHSTPSLPHWRLLKQIPKAKSRPLNPPQGDLGGVVFEITLNAAPMPSLPHYKCPCRSHSVKPFI